MKDQTAVIFMERKPQGELARKIRIKVTVMNKVGRQNMKVVERNDIKLVDVLSKSDSFGDVRCGRIDCRSHKSHEIKKTEWRKSNITYQNKLSSAKK